MSLIADALDAAQRERAKRSGVRPATFPDGPTSFRNVSKRTRPAIPREVGVALAGFAAVVVVVSLVSIMTASSRNRVRPVSAGAVAPPIPLPIQAPIIDSTAIAAAATTNSADSSLATGLDAYDRAIREYEPMNAHPRTLARSDLIDNADDELVPPEAEPAPVATPKGSFKITMQRATTAPVNDRMFQQALAAQQRGDFIAARDFYIRALSANPSNSEALNNLGAVHRSLGNLKLAEDAYRRALDIDPRFAAAWSNLAVVLDAQGKRQEATAALQESLRLDPRNGSTKVNLAIQFSSLGLYADARRLLEEALRDNNSLAEAHYTLGQVLEKQGDKVQAANEYKAFLQTSRGRFPRQEAQVRQHLKDLGANVSN